MASIERDGQRDGDKVEARPGSWALAPAADASCGR